MSGAFEWTRGLMEVLRRQARGGKVWEWRPDENAVMRIVPERDGRLRHCAWACSSRSAWPDA